MAKRKKNSSKEPTGGQLSRRGSSSLSQSGKMLTIGAMEAALLEEFPREDAESWDRNGLLVGEAALPVKKVAIALDPTVNAISEAAHAGADVLLTHHPAYLDPPELFAPASSCAQVSGAPVWAAIQNHIALMDFHTTLDVSPRVAGVLSGMLGFTFTGRLLKTIPTSQEKGYGQICTIGDEQHPSSTLAQVAARCTSVFGRQPRVWGNFRSSVHTVAIASGSAGDLAGAACEAGIDCLICGEIKYHDALDWSGAGLLIVELGHDVSELPFVAVLADALIRVGLSQDEIIFIDQSGNWSYPEAIRM